MQPHNIGQRLTQIAQRFPDQIAVAQPVSHPAGTTRYKTYTFAQLDADSSRIAAGLQQRGLQSGERIVLLVRPGIDFISLTFALFKAGAVVVLIDPGMGRHHLLQCLQDVAPRGFVAIAKAQLARILHRHRFPDARLNVTVGRRWGWGGATLRQLRATDGNHLRLFEANRQDAAAIIFTTGSTGPPKGVLYRHGNFASQVDQLQTHYQVQPGEVDLPGFPLFALFNSAMAVTTIIPDMDPTRPADVEPRNIIDPIRQWNVTQAFGSPALWNRVGKYCHEHQVKLPTLRRVLSAGAPVPPHVMQWMMDAIADGGDVHTPYGATEALPVASIAASEVLASTAARTAQGHGTCVGTPFPHIRWKVIAIDDGPIEHLGEATELPPGEVGELIVSGPVVTSEYVTRTETNRLAKIPDGNRFWHRMGDVGYLDDNIRFWFCGRKTHRVRRQQGTMFTIPCEAIFNQHPSIYRSALVGVGDPEDQQPVLIAEPWPEHWPASTTERDVLIDQLYELGQGHANTRSIARSDILLRQALPVDIRHNAKIFREELAEWVDASRRS